MPVYRFHLHNCDGAVVHLTPDEAADDPAEARSLAILKARAVMAKELEEGRLCLSCWIVVSDQHGHCSFNLQFGEAVEFTGHRDCAAAIARDVG